MLPKSRRVFRSGSVRASLGRHEIHPFFLPFDSRESVAVRPVTKTSSFKTKGLLFRSNKWVYDDRELGASNKIKQFTSHKPHFVLRDARGVPRFVLGYAPVVKGVVQIFSIQRVRNEYLPHDSKKGSWRWSAHAESRAAKELAQTIGIHPSEALVREFLFAFRKQIRAGRLKVQLDVGEEPNSLYGGIVDRFFKKKPVVPGVYELSFDKSRTKNAISAP